MIHPRAPLRLSTLQKPHKSRNCCIKGMGLMYGMINRTNKIRQWTLSHILNTHHHWDHTGANLELKERHGAIIIGPRADAERIPGIDQQVGDGEDIKLGGLRVHVYDTPGHTKGHISMYVQGAVHGLTGTTGALFCGDTLFAMGCGRLFEGTPAQMWTSLQKLAALPATTAVFCAHEYTQSNARFALHVDSGNAALRTRAAAVDAARAQVRMCVWPRIAMGLCAMIALLGSGDVAECVLHLANAVHVHTHLLCIAACTYAYIYASA